MTWSHPTARTDGTPLQLAQIGGTRVEWGTCANGAFGTRAGELVVAAPATTTTITGLGAGTWCVRAFSRDTQGRESLASAVASKTIAPPPPPIVTIAVVAGVAVAPVFALLSTGARSSTVVGFVPLGVACSGPILFAYRAQSYRRVDPMSVRWWATSPTTAIAAACGAGT